MARHMGARPVMSTDMNPARLALAAEMADVTRANLASEDLKGEQARLKMAQGFGVEKRCHATSRRWTSWSRPC